MHIVKSLDFDPRFPQQTTSHTLIDDMTFPADKTLVEFNTHAFYENK